MTSFHLAIGFAGPSVEPERIQNLFPTGCGWTRYAPNCWILSTYETPQQIVARIRTLIAENDSIFVVEINLNNNHGYLQKELWGYINTFDRPATPPGFPPKLF